MEMREHKKETKCGFGGVSMYDQQGIEKKLADMARKGWLIEEMQNAFFWNYCRIEPKELHFAAVYAAMTFDVDADSAAAQKEKDELCARDGWIAAASWGGNGFLRVYYNEQPDPVPIETDPVVQTESIYAAMKKRWPYFLGTILYALYCIITDIRSVITGYLGSNALLYWHLAFWSIWCCFMLYQLWADNRWYQKASIAAQQGVFLPLIKGRLRDIWVNYLLIILFVFAAVLSFFL